MHRWKAWTLDDRGSAPIEFIVTGLLFIVPLLYLVIALGAVQAQSLGVDAAARHVARVMATADDAGSAQQRADATLTALAAEYNLDRSSLGVTVTCVPAGAACPSAGATLIVTVTGAATLPMMPSLLGLDTATAIPISGTSTQKVSRFWGSEP